LLLGDDDQNHLEVVPGNKFGSSAGSTRLSSMSDSSSASVGKRQPPPATERPAQYLFASAQVQESPGLPEFGKYLAEQAGE
jgi:hypothetical protein